ncbi:phytoene desaturase family protein [Actinomadura keratinilytica]
MAHPFLDGGPAAVLARSVGESAASFGPRDAGAYRRLISPLLLRWEALFRDFMALPSTALPRDPLTLARFGLAGLPPASLLLRRFQDERARTLLAGLVGHIMAPLSGIATGAVALVFALAAHARGWPVARGGSQAISDALAGLLTDHGGTLHTGYEVKRLDDLPLARAYIFDTSPTALARIAGLGGYYDGYRYGAGVFKLDYALDGPVPWASPDARRATTVHLGASPGEIGAALRAVSREDRPPSPPFLITVQPSVADATRAPEGKQVFWVYGHVPNGWRGDLTDAIERRLEEYAPGFRDRVLARAAAARPSWPPATPTTSAGTSPAAPPPACSSSCAPSSPSPRTPPRTRPSSSAPRPPHRAPASTACPATTPPRPSGATCETRGAVRLAP